MQDSDSESTISTSSTCSCLSTTSATSLHAPGQTTKSLTRTESRLLLLPYDIRSLILREALPQQITYRCPKCHREGNVWKLGNITPMLLCRRLYDESFALMYKNANSTCISTRSEQCSNFIPGKTRRIIELLSRGNSRTVVDFVLVNSTSLRKVRMR